METYQDTINHGLEAGMRVNVDFSDEIYKDDEETYFVFIIDLLTNDSPPVPAGTTLLKIFAYKDKTKIIENFMQVFHIKFDDSTNFNKMESIDSFKKLFNFNRERHFLLSRPYRSKRMKGLIPQLMKARGEAFRLYNKWSFNEFVKWVNSFRDDETFGLCGIRRRFILGNTPLIREIKKAGIKLIKNPAYGRKNIYTISMRGKVSKDLDWELDICEHPQLYFTNDVFGYPFAAMVTLPLIEYRAMEKPVLKMNTQEEERSNGTGTHILESIETFLIHGLGTGYHGILATRVKK